MMGIGSDAAYTRSKTTEHAPKLHLDSGIVASRPDVSRLRALHSLRERRVAAFAIQLRTNVEDRTVNRPVTLSFRVGPRYKGSIFW